MNYPYDFSPLTLCVTEEIETHLKTRYIRAMMACASFFLRRVSRSINANCKPAGFFRDTKQQYPEGPPQNATEHSGNLRNLPPGKV